MRPFKATAHVTLKREVLDPQGDAIRRALEALGHESVSRVRVGKLVEIELEATSADDAKAQLQKMCANLLANPVVEDFDLRVEEAE